MARTLPIVFVVIWTVLVAGAAAGVNAWIAWSAAPPGPAPGQATTVAGSTRVAPTASPRPPTALGQEQYLDGIMGRNLFDIAMIDAWALRRPSPGGGVTQSALDVRLIATLVADPEDYSSALIEDKTVSEVPQAYSIGDMIHDRTVDSIAHDRVGLKKPDGTVEFLMLGSGELATASLSGSVAPEGDGSASAEGVTQLGENRYAITREVFDKYLNDPEGIAGLGRALLHRGPDGEYDGYRLSAIRRNSIADQLGIKNGDIVHTVNGQPLNSVQAAMGAFGSLKTESKFCFEVSRRGSPTELCYEVQ